MDPAPDTARRPPDGDMVWRPLARVVEVLDGHPVAFDLGLMLLLDAATAVPLLLGHENRWWVWLLDQALVAPLAARRSRPYAVFVLLAGLAFLQWLVHVPLAADAGLLVALFTVAAQQSWLRALSAAGVLEVGVVLASVRFAPASAGLAASLVFLSGLVLASLLGGVAWTTHLAYLASMVERTRSLERDRDQQAQIAVNSERTRIAREMHDVIAHGLSVIITLADGAALTAQRSPHEAGDAMALVSATGRDALTDMRRMLGLLREDIEPDRHPAPGLGSVDELCDRVRATGLHVTATVTGTPRAVPQSLGTAVYRVVQESLTNVLKHAASPTSVAVGLCWGPADVSVTVTDDGRPTAMAPTIAVPEARTPGSDRLGHGLLGMAERVHAFSGVLVSGPMGGAGWQVSATFPTGSLPLLGGNILAPSSLGLFGSGRGGTRDDLRAARGRPAAASDRLQDDPRSH